MAGFDRDALAAAAAGTQSNNDGKLFWALVIALPLIGIVVGLAFLPGGSKPPAPMVLGAVDSPQASAPAIEETPETAMDVAERPALVWSADAQMERYTTARQAMLACTSVMDYGTAYNVWRNFNDRNAVRFERLHEIKQAEYKAGAGARRDTLQRANNRMVLGMITGRSQAEALGRFGEMANLMQDMEDMQGQSRVRQTPPEILAFLGGEPNLRVCSKLSAELQRGQHDIVFEGR